MADPHETVLLVIPKPFENHNGGMLAFGPDGFLYIGIGDGGCGQRPQRPTPRTRASCSGKILRIDVDTSSGGRPYSSPSDQSVRRHRPARDEIYAYGLRNPWRFSFDRETGDLYVGDVGQEAVEEIDLIHRGDNAGWRIWEGSRCTDLEPGRCSQQGFVFPIAEYENAGDRCSVTGGYVYRGQRGSLPVGSYVYGDFCSGEIFVLENGRSSVALSTNLRISSFGEDEAGEIYVVGLDGAVARIAAVATAAPPRLTLAFNGKLRDRVGPGNTALSADGALDGTLMLTVSGGAGRTLTAVRMQTSAGGSWDTTSATGFWALGVARGPDGALLNQTGTMAVGVPLGDDESFTLFGADNRGRRFVPGRTLTVTATLAGGVTATARTTIPGAAAAPPQPRLTLAFNGKLRDRVGRGSTALGADDALDGTLTLTVSGGAGRTLTAVRMQTSAGGSWDTTSATGFWALGVARGPDGALLNQTGTMAVRVPLGGDESFTLFGADNRGRRFVPGRTLTVTATFAGGATATATTTVP